MSLCLASAPTAASLPGPAGAQTLSPLHVAACQPLSPSTKPPPGDLGQLAVRARRAELLSPPWPPRKPCGSGVSWALVTERFSPPHNISVQCNQSHCLIQWEKPRVLQKNLFDTDFQFQLDIQTAVRGRCVLEGLGPAERGDRGTGGGPRAHGQCGAAVGRDGPGPEVTAAAPSARPQTQADPTVVKAVWVF